MELFDSLTVGENIVLGREAHMAASRPLRHLLSPRPSRAAIAGAAEEAIELCGWGPWPTAGGGDLPGSAASSTGPRHRRGSSKSAPRRTLLRPRRRRDETIR